MLRLSPLGAARPRGPVALAGDLGVAPLSRWLEGLADRADLPDLPAEYIHMAGTMVSWQPGLDDDAQMSLALLLLASLQNMTRGSTRLAVRPPAKALRDLIAPLLSQDGEAPAAAHLDAHLERIPTLLDEGKLATLIGQVGENRPLILDGPFLYPHRLFVREQRLSATLAALQRPLVRDFEGTPTEALEDLIQRAPVLRSGQPMRLSDEQQAAILKAAATNLCVISGGPGTGKTSIIVSILRLHARLGTNPQKIALAAPTGKAAKRMESAIHQALKQIPEPSAHDMALREHLPAPSTLHRLLRYAPRHDIFLHDELNPLHQSLIIIDEASMIDLAMMDQLTRAASLAQLILLGDADQLPSVNAGAVLRDLVPPPDDTPHPMRNYAVRLEKSFRMDPSDPSGRHILQVARALIASQPDAFLHNDPAREPYLPRALQVEALHNHGAELLLAPEQTPQHNQKLLNRFVDQWFASHMAAIPELKALLDHTYTAHDGTFSAEDNDKITFIFNQLERFRVLCLTRGGPQGVHALNQALHLRLARFLQRDERTPWLPGEPAMMQLNDYDRQLFNGDQGLALNVTTEDSLRRRPETGLMLVFPNDTGGFTPFVPDALRGQVEWAHALTVHKSQGSEFDHVAIMLPERDSPLLTRELLYTAATRSRRSVIFFGDEQRLRTGTLRHVDRQSGITQRLSDAINAEQDANP